MNATDVSSAITPRLSGILTGATDADEAAQLILRDATLVSECRHLLPLVQRLAKPLGRTDIRVALQPLMLMFDPPSFGRGKEAEQLEGAWEETYTRALTGLCKEALDHAVAEWCKVGRTFPKPAHLRELADPIQTKAAMVAWRMRRAVDIAHQTRAAAPSQTPQERQDVRDGLKALLRDLGASTTFPETQKMGRDPTQAAGNLRARA